MKGQRAIVPLFMLLLWSNVAQGVFPVIALAIGAVAGLITGATTTAVVLGGNSQGPAPPAPTVINLPAPAPPPLPPVERIVTKRSCIDENVPVCDVYKGICQDCYYKCNTAAREYCSLAEADSSSRKRRSTPVRPAIFPVAQHPQLSVRQILMMYPRIAVEFDLNYDGHLSDEEFQHIAALKPEDILLKAADENEDGQVDKAEMKEILKNEGLKGSEWEVTTAFRSIDENLDDVLSRHELRTLIQGISQLPPERLPRI